MSGTANELAELIERGEMGEEYFATGPDAPARWLNRPQPVARYEADLPLSLADAAWVLGLTITKGARRGQPSREQVLNLIARGALRVVDPEMPSHRWTISPAELRRYMAGVAA